MILNSINQQILQTVAESDIQVLIADDGSTEATSSLIATLMPEFKFRLRHVWHDDVGYRRSMILNKAVAVATGDYLLFLDGDCIPAPDYIEQHVRLAESGYFVAGNRILLSQQYTKQLLATQNLHIIRQGVWGGIYNKLRGRTNKFLVSLRLSAQARWRKSRQRNWRFPKGCNLGIWRTDLLAVDGYDEAFTGWGHEDADLFIRLLHYGVRIKDGRFAVPVFHFWHRELDRSSESVNWQRLMDRLNDVSFTQALRGLKQYI